LQLIDSHIHLDFAAFDMDREQLIARAGEANIKGFVIPATTRDAWPRIAKLAQSHNNLYPAYGIHPYFIAGHQLSDCAALDNWLYEHPAVAVGEIGLDYFLKELDGQQQMQIFQAQLTIAARHTLPVILHARKAVDAVTQQLKLAGINRGIVHSFNGSYVQAGRLIDMGFKLGFGGALTYPRATRLCALVKKLPLDSICLETDAPDQPVARLYGARNTPDALLDVLNTIADIHQLSPEIIAKHSIDNTYAALNIC